jgi:hypothetical protein
MISRRRVGQRTIAVHALEILATSDTGIAMLRWTLRERIKRVSDGLDPMNVIRDQEVNRKIPNQRVEHHPVARRGNQCIREREREREREGVRANWKGRRASFVKRLARGDIPQ